MSMKSHDVIAIYQTIEKLNEAKAKELLLKILVSNPATIKKHLCSTLPQVTIHKPELYKVVIQPTGNNVIPLVKLYRQITGYGLAECKAWVSADPKCSVGNAFGVLHENLTKEEANKFTNQYNEMDGIAVCYLPQDAAYTYVKPWLAL